MGLAAPSAVLSAMLAEMGQRGLGYMFRAAIGDFDTERAFGTSALATVSVITFTLTQRAERAGTERWRRDKPQRSRLQARPA